MPDQIQLATTAFFMKINKEQSKNPTSKKGLKKSRMKFMGNYLQSLLITTIYKMRLMIG
jgi:hypothetical protein